MRISLEHAVVVLDANEASYVHHAVAELRRQLHAITGRNPELSHDLGKGDQPPHSTLIEVRTLPDQLAPEEFLLRVADNVIVVAGGDSMGTNYAVMRLRQLLAESPSGALLQADLNVRERPRYPVRGLYLHQHWRYNHPYATWSWSVEDWKHAIDMVAYMRLNFILIWPHTDMIAPPLSVAERDHLADLREVIDYAHRKRGIKVWLVEPANVLLDQPEVKSLPMEARDYYAYAHMKGGGLKNPADPKARASLFANREALYRHVPNADGYGYIDSDPGGWIGSPANEFVDLLAANRELIDRLHERPKEVTLFHWALAGWGTETPQQNWRDTMSGVTERVVAPRAFLGCFANHIELARELNHLPHTLLFPYGVIDGEPSFPLTALRFDQLQRAFEFADRYEGLAGVIGNVQTFLIQLPNIYCTASLAWDSAAANDSTQLLRSLAKVLFPTQTELLVEAWSALQQPGSKQTWEIMAGIESLLEGRDDLPTGTIGEFVFPKPTLLFEDLAILLRIHALAETVTETAVADLPGAVTNYLIAMLDWQKRNGFFGTYGVNKTVLYDQFMYSNDSQTVRDAWKKYTEGRDRTALEAAIVADLLALGYTDSIVRAMSGQLFGTASMKYGEIEEVIFDNLPPAKETMPWTQPG